MGIGSKLGEVGKEVAALSAAHGLMMRLTALHTSTSPGSSTETKNDDKETTRQRRARCAAVAIFLITATRWREESRRLLSLFLAVRSIDIFQGAFANKTAVLAAFMITAGTLGRRWRDWASPRAAAHGQFISIMGNLSGMPSSDWPDLANRPMELVKRPTFSWKSNFKNATRFCFSLMAAAYGLQEAIKLMQYLYSEGKRKLNARYATKEPQSGRDGALSPGGIQDILDKPVVPIQYKFDPIKYVTKVVRTTSIYLFLSTWTVAVFTRGCVPNSSESPWFSMKNLIGQSVMSMFGVFALEPLSRGRLLAEYYIVHTLYIIWSDIKNAALANGISAARHFDKLILPWSIYYAMTTDRHAALRSLLRSAEI